MDSKASAKLADIVARLKGILGRAATVGEDYRRPPRKTNRNHGGDNLETWNGRGLRPLPEIAAEKGACLLTRNQDRNLAIFFKKIRLQSLQSSFT
jgi:hypothetical protein